MNRNVKAEKTCVLLVDDDCDWRTVMRDAVVAVIPACDVREVCDGQQAVEFLRRERSFSDAPRPNLIFLDAEMPARCA